MLEANDAVAWVKYPTASDHPDRALAAELYPNGTGAILSFGVKGGAPPARRSSRASSSRVILPTSATPRPVLHPASTTHQQLSPRISRPPGSVKI